LFYALDFHHIDDKLFTINDALIRKIKVTPQQILEEINKCTILCRNCHRDEHFDIDKFNVNKQTILNNSNNMREIQKKIDRQEVQSMLDSGMKQIEIARHFNASKGTISNIVKWLKSQQ
jgi:DNA-binding NarL/FixJ family response regulator